MENEILLYLDLVVSTAIDCQTDELGFDGHRIGISRNFQRSFVVFLYTLFEKINSDLPFLI